MTVESAFRSCVGKADEAALHGRLDCIGALCGRRPQRRDQPALLRQRRTTMQSDLVTVDNRENGGLPASLDSEETQRLKTVGRSTSAQHVDVGDEAGAAEELRAMGRSRQRVGETANGCVTQLHDALMHSAWGSRAWHRRAGGGAVDRGVEARRRRRADIAPCCRPLRLHCVHPVSASSLSTRCPSIEAAAPPEFARVACSALDSFRSSPSALAARCYTERVALADVVAIASHSRLHLHTPLLVPEPAVRRVVPLKRALTLRSDNEPQLTASTPPKRSVRSLSPRTRLIAQQWPARACLTT